MGEQYTHALLRAVVGQLCQPLGWNALQSSACDVLVDLLKSYLHTVAKTTAGYSVHANRTEPNLSDLALAFRDLGINLSEVSEFCREVESNPCAHVVPKYPLTKKSYHVYNGPSSHTMVRGSRNSSFSTDEEDEGYIPSYLPPLPQKGDGSNDDDNESGIHVPSDDEAMDVVNSSAMVPDSSKGLPRIFRRALSSDHSEEGDPRSRRNSISDVTLPLGTEEREPNPVQAVSSLAVVSLRPTISTTPTTTPTTVSSLPATASSIAPLPSLATPPPVPLVSSTPLVPVTPHVTMAPPVLPTAHSAEQRAAVGLSGDEGGNDIDVEASDDDDDGDGEDGDDGEGGEGDGGDVGDRKKVSFHQKSSNGARSSVSAVHPAPETVPSTVAETSVHATGKASSFQRTPRTHDPGDLVPIKPTLLQPLNTPLKPKLAAGQVPTKSSPRTAPSIPTTPAQSPVHRASGKGAVQSLATPPESSVTSPYKAHPAGGSASSLIHSKESAAGEAKTIPVQTAHNQQQRSINPVGAITPVGASFHQPSASTDTRGFEEDLEVSSSEDSPPGSVPEPAPCPANVEPGREHLSRKRMKEESEEEEEEEEIDVDTGDDEEVRGGHGAKVKLHSGQLHTEDWERGEVIKASPIRDEDGWPFALPKAVDGNISPAWEVLSSLEEDEELSVGEEPLPPVPQVRPKAVTAVESKPLSLVVRVNRKHLVKQKPTLQGARGMGNPPVGHLPLQNTTLPAHLGEQESVSLVVSINKRLLEGHKGSGPAHQHKIGGHPTHPSAHQHKIGGHPTHPSAHQHKIGGHPTHPPALGKTEKKPSKPSRKRELDISEIGPIEKEPKKIKIIPQPSSSSGSSSDGEEGSHPSHDWNTKQRVELKVKLKLDKAVVHTSSASSFKADKKAAAGSLSKGSSHKTKSKKSKPHQPPPAVVPAVVTPSSHKVPIAPLPPPTVPIGSDYICPQCGQHDDGTPMICCDSCDEWLHWRCVGITQPPPEQVPWFCPSCQSKNLKKSKKKKKH